MLICPRPECRCSNPDNNTYCGFCGKKLKATEKRRRTKSSNGQGTVIKLNGRRAKSWGAYAPSVKGVDGKRHRQFIGTFATEGEARSAILSRPLVANTGLYNFSVKQVYEVWKAEHFPSVGQSAQRVYGDSWANLSNPVRWKNAETGEEGESYAICDKRARELTKLDFQQIINALARSGKSRAKCEKVKQLMSQLSKWCVEHELHSRNLAEHLTLPAQATKEKRIFCDEELRLVEEQLQSESDTRKRIAQITMILCYTGFRVSALAQMQIKNIHLDEDVDGKNISYMIGGVKTEMGRNRVVPVNSRIYPIIKNLVGDKGQEEWLFQTGNGTPMMIRNIQRDFSALCQDIGVEGATLHSCRHTYATKHARAETRPEILAKLMGHTDYDVTKIYTHSDLLDLVAADAKII